MRILNFFRKHFARFSEKDAAPLPSCFRLAATLDMQSRLFGTPQHPRLIAFLSAVTNLQKFTFVLFFRNSLVLQPRAIMTRDTCLPSPTARRH